MEMNPLITIITINYNNAGGLDRTIQSVISQTSKDYEYVVIDGGSTDASQSVIEKHHHRIRFSISEKDDGIYHAMNKGVHHSLGKYLLFLNSGDELVNSNIIETVQSYLENVDFIYFDLLLLSNQHEEVKKYPDNLDFRYFLVESLPHPATFIKREILLADGGYDQSLKICSDWAFFILMICKRESTYKHIPVVLSKFNLNGISSTLKNRALIAAEKQFVLDRHFSMYAPMIHELEEYKRLKFIFENSRLIKLAKAFGFLNPPD